MRYPYKLKRKAEVRTLMMVTSPSSFFLSSFRFLSQDATRLIVIDNNNHCTVYSRSKGSLFQQFNMPCEVQLMKPLQSHMVSVAVVFLCLLTFLLFPGDYYTRQTKSTEE